jgi:hypothetical protein
MPNPVPVPPLSDSPGATPGPAAPSSFTGGPGASPSVSVRQYNPRTGKYIAPDGQQFRQTDLMSPSTAKSWKDMFPS